MTAVLTAEPAQGGWTCAARSLPEVCEVPKAGAVSIWDSVPGLVELLLPPASMSDSFGRWLDGLSEIVSDIDRFGLGRHDCDLHSDFRLFSQNATSTG